MGGMTATAAERKAEIRLARAADADGLERLYRQLVDDPAIRVLPERLQALADGERAQVLVCECEGRLAASAWLGFCEDVMYGGQPFAVLENIVVDRDWRGRGLGRALLDEARRRCMARGCSKIMLLSSAQRTDAHRFFLQAGFRGDAKRGFVMYRRDMAATQT